MDFNSSSRLVSSSTSPSQETASSNSSSSSSSFLKYFKKKNGNTTEKKNSPNNSDENKENSGCTFTVGVAEDKNRKCRRTMEDAHTYIYNFRGNPDDGYFAVFDGHAGRQAAEWCSKKMHLLLEGALESRDFKSESICHGLNTAFSQADTQMKEDGLNNSGCTAAVVVIGWEPNTNTTSENDEVKRRVLYAANVGDTRVILCRSGKALRLSYDHKGSDTHESKRIMNSGGIMVNNRVNGVLAVTRSLGDSYMKQLVSGSPYTTETQLQPQDEFIIVACDGLWDVCSDQQAVELIRDEKDAASASRLLVDYALDHFSSDNLTCMVIRLH